VLELLGNSQFSALVRSELWGWPLALTIHVLGTALVVGFVFIVGLRLLGFFKMFPYTSLSRLFPVIWVALAIQYLSGFTLWMTKPTQYVADGGFMLKVSLVVVGTILTMFFYRTIKREAPTWEAKGGVSPRGIKFVAATLLVWGGALVASRLTAYLGSIYIG
jgi:hypothetical protein